MLGSSMERANSLSRCSNWQVEIEKDNKDKVLIIRRMNQNLKQYLRMFITKTKASPFRENNEQIPCMGFKIRKKKKFERTEEFAMRIKKVHKEAKVTLRKSQEKIRKYTDKKKSEIEE